MVGVGRLYLIVGLEKEARLLLRLALVGTCVDLKASRRKVEVVSEVPDTKGYAA